MVEATHIGAETQGITKGRIMCAEHTCIQSMPTLEVWGHDAPENFEKF